MIHVLATITVKPGCREAFLHEFHQVMPAVHAEEGCLAYGPAIDVATGLTVQLPLRPDVVTVVEQWQSVEALRAHLASAHMATYRERVKDLVIGLQLQVVEPA
jgi:quinol monooxygenase YgiN